jgi:hypothetical protein
VKSLADPTLLRKWLTKKLRLQILESLILGFLAFVGGIAVLILIFFFSCAVVGAGMMGLLAFSQLALGKALHLSLYWIPAISTFFLILLFIENLRTSRDYLGSYKLQNRVMPANGLWDALGTLLVNPEATGKIVADMLFTGPRLVTWSFINLARIFRLMRTDLETASDILSILARRLHRISLNEVSKMILGRDPMKTLFLLQEIDCVLFLAKEPAGVILMPDTREELNSLPGMPDFETATEEEPEDEPVLADSVEDLEYYELLGVQSAASLAEIKSAYRKRIKQCHPDKFVGRGGEFRQLAEERAKMLNEAYAILTAKHKEHANVN